MLFRKRFRLIVDGEVRGYFKTEADARALAPGWGDEYDRWCTQKLVGGRRHGRWFVESFGWSGSGTSGNDLAAMGVPIHPSFLTDDPLSKRSHRIEPVERSPRERGYRA